MYMTLYQTSTNSKAEYTYRNNQFEDDRLFEPDLVLPDNVFASLTSLTNLYGYAMKLCPIGVYR